MRDYINISAGCFDGEGLVKLGNGSIKKVKELKKGDKVICANGASAKVISLIRTLTKEPVTMVEIGGVKLTPWHPIRVNGAWKFPCEIGHGKEECCDMVYNLVLDKEHIVLINDQEVVTLGHGFKDDAVVQHEYFGSQKVINDLMRFKGWNEGDVLINYWNSVRDPITKLVTGINH